MCQVPQNTHANTATLVWQERWHQRVAYVYSPFPGEGLWEEVVSTKEH